MQREDIWIQSQAAWLIQQLVFLENGEILKGVLMTFSMHISVFGISIKLISKIIIYKGEFKNRASISLLLATSPNDKVHF